MKCTGVVEDRFASAGVERADGIEKPWMKDSHASKQGDHSHDHVSKLIEVLRELYSNFTNGISPFYKNIIIDVKRGVRQGDTISPKIFTAALENSMRKLEWEDMGVKVDTESAKNDVHGNGWVSDAPFTLNGTNIWECTSYVYLGGEMNMMNDLTPELGRRGRAELEVYKSIEDVVKKTMNSRLRAHLFNTTVLPALISASET
ncbi:hypothetical protein RB195_019008 [Necator americanus]|uniref:Reverse transcriptase domain-containing protein n=1 Tax=Necator americanus TaxID=51031 RepID=A0ABR1CC69_NECAM